MTRMVRALSALAIAAAAALGVLVANGEPTWGSAPAGNAAVGEPTWGSAPAGSVLAGEPTWGFASPSGRA
ncbi:hypothetical protein [Streptomyces mesophilus]|uniref:hypothetical protein n=1 Tax=Streptomyces mesophilus TaxID=1775132 RepID=UPI0033271AC4